MLEFMRSSLPAIRESIGGEGAWAVGRLRATHSAEQIRNEALHPVASLATTRNVGYTNRAVIMHQQKDKAR
jgi:hypothetical protein